MRYTLLICAAPQSGEAANSAYRFAKAALASGHSIERLFFYGDGAHNASRLTVMPQDEPNLPARWDAFIREHRLESTACVSSAIRRGVVDATESERHELDAVSCYDSSEIGGLGQLVDAMSRADRVVSFG